MTKNLSESFSKFNKSVAKEVPQIAGELGIPIGGSKVVEIPSRPSFVYVRLRNNTSEVIQAFNDKVSSSYGLPVLLERQGNRYVVIGRDTERYGEWGNSAAYLPRHANTHNFGSGGDVAWIEGQQFMPALTLPSGSVGANNVVLSSYSIKNLDGIWKSFGGTGTASLTQYNPKSGSSLVLINIDTTTGNPYLLATTGTYIPENITGTANLLPYLPYNNDPRYVPDSFVRVTSGTTAIEWRNIYDVRQFISVVPTGTNAMSFIQDEGVAKGTVSTLNFVGSNVDVSVSGTVARVFVTGSSGGGGGTVGGSNHSVQYNSSGTMAGDSNLTWDETAKILYVKGDTNSYYGGIFGVSDADSSGLWIYGGDSAVTGINGGDVEIDGGRGNATGTNAGAIFINGGSTDYGTGGDVVIYGGSAQASAMNAGSIYLNAGENGSYPSYSGYVYIGSSSNGLKVSISGDVSFIGTAKVADGTNIPLGTGTGTKIGTSTSQKLGFWNKTPVVQPSAYTATNVTTDRSYDADSTTLAEIADILGTLITDLKNMGLIG